MMRRREALTLIAGSLLSTGLLSAVMAKPGKGKGGGHGGGGNGGGGTGGSGGPGTGGGKKPKNVVLNGTVKEVGGDAAGFTLHVNGHGPGGYDVTVTTSEDTRFVKGEAPVEASAVNAGAQVQVRGALDTETQTLAASQVKLKKPGKGDGSGGTGAVQVEGSVVSTNTTGFVVHPPAVNGVQPPDVSVAVTGTTTFTKPDSTAGSMADVVVGALVKVQGTVDAASSSLVASSVAVTAAAPPPAP